MTKMTKFQHRPNTFQQKMNKDVKEIKKETRVFVAGQSSYDGAESCELCGLYIIFELAKLNIDVGLYRDDGLAVTSTTPRQVKILKKNL